MNWESAYLAALEAAIARRGGTVPPLDSPTSFNRRSLQLYDALLATTGAAPVPNAFNYPASVLAKLAAMVAALGGAVPPGQINYYAALLAHLEALAVASGGSTVGLPANFYDRAIALVGAVGAFDADALAYMTAVEAADGQALESALKLAYNDFFVGVKADGDFSKLRAACILGGARSLAGALVPLVATMPTPTNFGFVAGDRSRAGGLKGNGINKYLNANRQSDADPHLSYHMVAYLNELGSNTSPVICSGWGSTRETTHLVQGTGVMTYRSRHLGTVGSLSHAGAGVYGSSRSSSANYSIISPQAESLVPVAASTSTSRKTFVLGRNNLDTGDGDPVFFGDDRVLFYSVGESLSLSNLRSRLNTLAAALATL